MRLSVYEQCEVFYFSFVFGAVLGVYYDFFRLLRYLGFTSKRAVFFQDVIYMCTIAVASSLYFQTVVNGHVRFFVLAAMLFGAVSYRYSLGMLSGYVFSAVRFVIRKLTKAFLSTTEFLNSTAVNVLRKISSFWRTICRVFVKNRNSLKKDETISK